MLEVVLRHFDDRTVGGVAGVLHVVRVADQAGDGADDENEDGDGDDLALVNKLDFRQFAVGVLLIDTVAAIAQRHNRLPYERRAPLQGA